MYKPNPIKKLWDEFDHLYNTLFAQGENYISVVYELSKKKNGLTRENISKATGLALNGVLYKIIKNLVDSGFVRENPFFGKKKKDTLYQLADYYSSFYFNYIRDNRGRDEHYWSNTLDAPARKTWAGNMFMSLAVMIVFGAAIKSILSINLVLLLGISQIVYLGVLIFLDGYFDVHHKEAYWTKIQNS